MKTQNLFALALGTLVMLTGCKSPERFVALGTPGGGSGQTAGRGAKLTDIGAAPIELTGSTTGTGVTGAEAGNDKTGLPDDTGLSDRDMDRSAFAADTVYFGYDLASVKTTEAEKVTRVLEALKSRGTGYDLLIEGHADERGTEEYNRALGERRALAIRELLVKSGLEGTQVFTRTFGKDQPAVAARNEEAYSKNRRGEFVLVLPKKLITTQNTK